MSKVLEIRKQILQNRIDEFVNRGGGVFSREENLIVFKNDPTCPLKDYEIIQRRGKEGTYIFGPQGARWDDIIKAHLIFEDYVYVYDISDAIYG